MTGHSSAGDGRIDHFLPLYVRDFLTSTIGWTAEERGHYLMLLMISWDRGGLPADLPGLERISPGVTACWGLLEGKFPVADDGLRRNPRLEGHRSKALDVRRKRAEAGALGAQARAKQMPSKCSANGSTRFQQASGKLPEPDSDASAVLAEAQERRAENPSVLLIQPKLQANAKHLLGKAQAKVKQPEPEPHIEDSIGVGDFPALGTGPSPAPSSAPRGSIDAGAWARLLQEWNAGTGAPWPSKRPPAEAVAALTDPEWLEIAFKAIDHLPRCKFLRSPPDLTQFCSDQFAAKIVSGKYDTRFDDKAGPTPGEEAARARKDADMARMRDEYVRSKDEKRAARLAEQTKGG